MTKSPILAIRRTEPAVVTVLFKICSRGGGGGGALWAGIPPTGTEFY
jgi:hypothetical protein